MSDRDVYQRNGFNVTVYKTGASWHFNAYQISNPQVTLNNYSPYDSKENAKAAANAKVDTYK